MDSGNNAVQYEGKICAGSVSGDLVDTGTVRPAWVEIILQGRRIPDPEGTDTVGGRGICANVSLLQDKFSISNGRKGALFRILNLIIEH